VKKLSAILRVADGLDRSHYQNVRDLKVEMQDSKATIWIKTESDPHLEIWGALRKKALFEEMLNARLTIEPVERI
jgi:exopolyphosphatase/guanosine-5'-triphosphate,3'-diphosphate pyrophosphatase